MRKLYILFFSAIVFATGCTNPEKENSNLQIEGTISNAPQKELYLNMFSPQGYNAVDTVQLSESGEFELYTTIEEWGFYQLGFSQANAVNLILVPGDELQLTGDGSDLIRNNSVTGSQEAETYLNLIQQQLAVRAGSA